MLRLWPMSAVLAACAPSPQEATMTSPSSVPGVSDQGADDGMFAGPRPTVSGSTKRMAGRDDQAMQGPIPQAVSAADHPAPPPLADTPAEAAGRRTLSTAFVRVGPDGHLTVTLRDGRMLVLRDVTMGPRHFNGVQVSGGGAGARFRGGYADVASARPGAAAEPAAGRPKPGRSASPPR